jgi:3-dehydroquinate synthase II
MPDLQFCKLVSIEPIGEGTRVCLDLIDCLDPEEGLLLGDTAHGYLLVLSENRASTTYPARPFRVNCGAIHQYLLGGNVATCYLSELHPERSVTVVHGRTGDQRSIPIGRIKMEKRPLLRITANDAGRRISATLQDADSVRLFTRDGSAPDVRSLSPGDAICFYPDEPGRHLGQRINEAIREL